jgi:hypothetical protein
MYMKATDMIRKNLRELCNEAYGELSDTYLGKNIIITDNHEWSTEDIIFGYRGQYVIREKRNRQPNRLFLRWTRFRNGSLICLKWNNIYKLGGTSRCLKVIEIKCVNKVNRR